MAQESEKYALLVPTSMSIWPIPSRAPLFNWSFNLKKLARRIKGNVIRVLFDLAVLFEEAFFFVDGALGFRFVKDSFENWRMALKRTESGQQGAFEHRHHINRFGWKIGRVLCGEGFDLDRVLKRKVFRLFTFSPLLQKNGWLFLSWASGMLATAMQTDYALPTDEWSALEFRGRQHRINGISL